MALREQNPADQTLDSNTVPAPPVRADANLEETLDGTAAATRRPAIIVPEIDGYAITGRLGEGGMGVVWKAKQHGTHRPVALKLMSAASFGSECARLRFQREVDLTARFEHPHIARVYDGGENRGICYYAMEFIDGVPLDQHVREEKLVRRKILELMKTICEAVQYAHQKGVIHRDLKPANILVDKEGKPRVLDFGLAKALSEDDGQMLSMDMGAAGTPAYMSPEQACGRLDQVDTRSDVYTLGVILFYLLSGKYPHDIRGSALEVMKRISESEPCRLKEIEPNADRDLEAILTKSLSREPERRYGTAGDLAADLGRYISGEPVIAQPPTMSYLLSKRLRRHRVPLVLAVGICAALVGMAVWDYVRVTRERNVAMASERRAVANEKLAIENGNEAKRNAERANLALAELKKSAPALLQLAESEADFQRFDSALTKIDAALALDPSLHAAYRQRAWALLGLGKWSEVAAAMRIARQNDPAGNKWADIFPAVEAMAAAKTDSERWQSDSAREVFRYLKSVDAVGAALAFAGKLRLSSDERVKLTEQRLLATFGKGNYSHPQLTQDGLVRLAITSPIRSLEAVRGLPVDALLLSRVAIADLEPLRRMHLKELNLLGTRVSDLGPLRGMALESLGIGETLVTDLSPLKGMPLRSLNMENVRTSDLSPLVGMPLHDLDIGRADVANLELLHGMPLVVFKAHYTANLKDCSSLKGAPLQELDLMGTKVSDLSFVRGMPLRSLNVSGTRVADLAALRSLPLEILKIDGTAVSDISVLEGMPLTVLSFHDCKKLHDFSTIFSLPRLELLACDQLPEKLIPLRQSKSLKTIEAQAYSGEGGQSPRPVAQFWAAYDAHQQHPPAPG